MGNPFEVATALEAKKPRFEYVLTEDDRKYVERGLGALRDEFEKTSEKDFPDLLIFLDTGVRPLAAGVLPVARAVAEKRGLEVPDNRFLAGSFRDAYQQEMLAARESGDQDWKEKFIQLRIENEKQWRFAALEIARQRRIVIAEESPSFFESVHKTREEILVIRDKEVRNHEEALANADERIRAQITKLIQDVEANELALAERLKEILADTEAKNVMIIDDYLAEGLTMKQVLTAFKRLDKASRPNVTFMSFFAKTLESWGENYERTTPTYELTAEAEKKAWLEEGFRVLLPSKEANSYRGFIYSHKPHPHVHSKEDIKSELKRAFIGVEKVSGRAIAKVSAERDQELMLQLRHEMKDIAQQVLKHNE